jgi:hypothetical protein
MSKSLAKLIKKHPKLIAEYRNFIIKIAVEMQNDKEGPFAVAK